MSMKLVVGLDGHATGEKALSHAIALAKMAGGAEILVVHIIEWSPYSFHTAEENAMRHKRREEEIALAQDRIVAPAVKAVEEAGLKAAGKVRHGDVADTLDAITKEEKGDQIIVARASDGGFASRLFGSATSNLVMGASVPVTVVN